MWPRPTSLRLLFGQDQYEISSPLCHCFLQRTKRNSLKLSAERLLFCLACLAIRSQGHYSKIYHNLNQRPDQYKMKILVFSIQMIFKYWSISISTQSEEYWIISTVIYHRTYWISISISMLKNWSISIQYQYPFWKKCDKTSKPSRFEKWRQTWVFIE